MLEASMSAEVTGVTWKRRKIPCSRKVTKATLSPQKAPMTAKEITGPSKKRTAKGSPFAKTTEKRKKKPNGMIKPKNKNSLLRRVRRMRMPVKVRKCFNREVSCP